jgi:hypothetical protein
VKVVRLDTGRVTHAVSNQTWRAGPRRPSTFGVACRPNIFLYWEPGDEYSDAPAPTCKRCLRILGKEPNR